MFSCRRRFLCLWLPHWPADRWRRARRRRGVAPPGGPLVLVEAGQGGVRLTAVDEAAVAVGLGPGMTLADARALVPGLVAVDADPAADAAALGELADWCGRYAPWTATDGADGIRLDITGSAHLVGGEEALIADLERRLAAAGIAARIAIADTPGAGWAVARYGPGGAVPEGKVAAALSGLPVAALRLGPEIVQGLSRVGVRSIGELARLPRAPLVLRFGAAVAERLDQAFGHLPEPISPRREPVAFRVRLAFAEQIGRREDIEAATRRMLDALVAELERAGRGLRRLDLVCYRVDGACQRIGIGTAAPNRSAGHLFKLLAERFDRVEPGFGIEAMALEAASVDPMPPQQLGDREGASIGLAELIDRLQNRLGPGQVVTALPVDSHIPERAVVFRPADGAPAQGRWPVRGPRPIALLPAPERIEVAAPADPDEEAPPARFTWRRVARTVARAEGPERIGPEWWRLSGVTRTRDYWRLEDDTGRRYWVYRDPAGWYLQGLFA